MPTAKLVGCVVGREDVHAVGGCPYHLSRARLDVTRADSDKFEGVGGVECAGTGRPGMVPRLLTTWVGRRIGGA